MTIVDTVPPEFYAGQSAATDPGRHVALFARMPDDVAMQGFALGITAHGIGTAAAVEIDDVAVAFAALGMGLNGVATTVLAPLIIHLAARH